MDVQDMSAVDADSAESPTSGKTIHESHVAGKIPFSDDSNDCIDKMGGGWLSEDQLAEKAVDLTGHDEPGVYNHMCTPLFLSLTAMSFLWVGGQIPLYLYGSVITLIYSEIGGANGQFLWLVIGFLIPNAAVCPFVGALSDIFGRKVIAAFGQLCLIIGPAIVSSASSINVAVVGMVIAGLGAGLNELISLAGTSELVPVRKRPIYVGAVVATILPFSPSVLWADLIVQQSGTWRWVGALVCIWNFVGLLLLLVCYRDPPRMKKRSTKTILREVDYLGGFLSIAGATILLIAMEFGAQEAPWNSAKVLVPFFIGLALIVGFFMWEIQYAPYPMVPKALFSIDKRSMVALLIITFFSGGNYYAVILFWPPESYSIYGENPIQNGFRGLPIGFGIVTGAFVSLMLFRVFKGRTRWLTVFWTMAMTAFSGAMSVARTDNLPVVYGIISASCVTVGATVVSSSIWAQIIAPTELIGTMTAITLAVRTLGGLMAYTAYFNIFLAKYGKLANKVGFELAVQGISYDYETLFDLVNYASRAEYTKLRQLIDTSSKVMHKDTAYDTVMGLVHPAFASAYRWPYWMSIPFGVVCVVSALALRDLRQTMKQAR